MWPWICTALCLFSRVTLPSPVVSACSDALPSDPEPDLANFLWMLSQFSSVQPLSCVRLFVTPWTAACQASLSITNSQSLLKLMSIQLVISYNHLILCHPFLFLLQSFPASGSFPVSRFLNQVAKVLEFQLQHQTFQ